MVRGGLRDPELDRTGTVQYGTVLYGALGDTDDEKDRTTFMYVQSSYHEHILIYST